MTLEGFKRTLLYYFPELTATAELAPRGVTVYITDLGPYAHDVVARTVREEILPLPLEATIIVYKEPITEIENLWIWCWDEWARATERGAVLNDNWWVCKDWGFMVQTSSFCLCCQEDAPVEPPLVDDVVYECPRTMI